MARGNPGRAPLIGSRWPYKALNYLPSKQLWKYLTWKSGGDHSGPPFTLDKNLSGPLKILIRLPEDLQSILVAFPAVQCLVQGMPQSEFLFLAPQPLTGFLSAMFGPERILGVQAQEFHWGEPHFQELVRATAAFKPDLILNLAQGTEPLMHFLLRSTKAPMRAQVAGDAIPPFANIFLNPTEPGNHLRGYLLALKLWDFSERPIVPKWSRLAPGPENIKEAYARLGSKGLRPESTRLFLWQGASPARERELFKEAVQERSGQGTALSLAVVYGAGPLWASPAPPQDLILSTPCFEVESTGKLLALFASAARSIGTNGPLLHLAGLTDTDVEARFEERESAWDTAFLNPRMKVKYDKPERPAENQK
jgi:hypothetical protein